MLWNSSATEHNTIMLWAICTVAFFGFFRLGEIIPSGSHSDPMQHLARGDIAVDDRENPSLLQVHLKISKTDQLRKGTDIYIGKTDDDICPVAAVLVFLAVRGQIPGPLFICHDGKPCTKDWFIPKLRSALETADSTIKALGRWHSSAYLAYVRLPKEQLAFAARLGSDLCQVYIHAYYYTCICHACSHGNSDSHIWSSSKGGGPGPASV